MSVFCKKQGHKLRVYSLVRTEVPAEETADELSIDGSVISWEMDVFEISENAFEIGS